MKTNTEKWLYGLFSAAIGAAANAIPLMIVDPATFNINEGLHRVFTVAGISALVAVAMYLKQSPLPSPDKPEETK